jgi:hypothetical protein
VKRAPQRAAERDVPSSLNDFATGHELDGWLAGRA